VGSIERDRFDNLFPETRRV